MKRIIILIVILIMFYSFIACSGSTGVEDNTNMQIQANSDEADKRIENIQIEVNNASTNINIIKNSNHSNLSNDELRNRIINAAKKVNFNK